MQSTSRLRGKFGRKRFTSLVVGLVCLHTATAGAIDAEALREQGLAEYAIGHYAAAAQLFRSAADRGDARSPEILALMYRYGERLYGSQVLADPAESARWAAMAAERNLPPVTRVGATTP